MKSLQIPTTWIQRPVDFRPTLRDGLALLLQILFVKCCDLTPFLFSILATKSHGSLMGGAEGSLIEGDYQKK